MVIEENNKSIYILGIGHNTEVFIDLAESCGYKIKGLYHYNNDIEEKLLRDIPIIGSNSMLFEKSSLEGMNFAISVGDNRIRKDISARIRFKGGNLVNLIHPSSIVSKYADIRSGVVILPNSVVQAGVIIKKDTIVSYNVSVTHHSKIGSTCYLAAGCSIGAYVDIGQNVLIGQSAVLVSSKVKIIGSDSIIGAGAVVINNVTKNSIVVGNPAKVIVKK